MTIQTFKVYTKFKSNIVYYLSESFNIIFQYLLSLYLT